MTVKDVSRVLSVNWSLIDYLENSDYLDDHVLRYKLLFDKNNYTEAENELSDLYNYTYDLSTEKLLQYDEFEDVASLLIEVVQLPDSIADSLIISNETMLQAIANTDFHVAQSDAKALLEKTGQEQYSFVWLPDETTELKIVKLEFPVNYTEDRNLEDLIIYPNPSDGNFIVQYQLPAKEGKYKLLH